MKFLLFLCLLLPFAWAQDPEASSDDDLEEEVDPVSDALEKARQNFQKAKKGIQADYRKGIAEAVELADSVEIYLLDFEMIRELPEDGVSLSGHVVEGSESDWESKGEEVESVVPGYFLIEPYGTFSKILKRKVIDGKVLEASRTSVVDLLKQPNQDASAWCHYPIHGIRMASKDGRVIFQTSICYACGNYFMTYPDDFRESNWIDFESEKLADFLNKEMPIPKSEMERFKKKHGR